MLIVRSDENRSLREPSALSLSKWLSTLHAPRLVPYLLAHAADLNWSAPWSGQTPLDIAEQAGRSDVVAWLIGKGASRGKKSP